MRIAHTADWHLGYRRFERTAQGGKNQRELDVALAVTRLIDDVIEQAPDVMVVAGDVFHAVRPPNSAIILLFEQLQKLRRARPEMVVIMAAGNHDTPRTSESSPLLPLAERLDIHVAALEPKIVECGGVRFTVVPSAAAARIPEPDPGSATNVLVLHAGVAGFSGPAPRDAADPEALARAGYDYIALGDYHVAAQAGPRAWYSGALEFTATDPWSELRKECELGLPGKGYLLVTVPGPHVEFRPIGPARRHLDLAPLEATGLSVDQIDGALAERLNSIDIDGACVRLVVREIPRDYKRALNYGPIRAWKTRALDLHLDLRAPTGHHTPAARQQMHKTLDEFVEFTLGQRPLPPDMDRQSFVAKGLEYLKTAAGAADPYTGDVDGST